MAQIVYGKPYADALIRRIARAVKRCKRSPCLVIILVGTHAPSEAYVAQKIKYAQKAGIHVTLKRLSAVATTRTVIKTVTQSNSDARVDGVIVQLPLPKHVDTHSVLRAISPEKDVDGFHPYNMGAMTIEDGGLFPATPAGIMILLRAMKVRLQGAHAVIVGASVIVGKPLALMLMNAHATVTVCHKYTRNLADITRQADILISATGKPGLITAPMVKHGAVVIDAGWSHVRGKIYGDVDFEHVSAHASHITPVPGGVGPMTVACLLKNTLTAYQNTH